MVNPLFVLQRPAMESSARELGKQLELCLAQDSVVSMQRPGSMPHQVLPSEDIILSLMWRLEIFLGTLEIPFLLQTSSDQRTISSRTSTHHVGGRTQGRNCTDTNWTSNAGLISSSNILRLVIVLTFTRRRWPDLERPHIPLRIHVEPASPFRGLQNLTQCLLPLHAAHDKYQDDSIERQEQDSAHGKERSVYEVTMPSKFWAHSEDPDHLISIIIDIGETLVSGAKLSH